MQRPSLTEVQLVDILLAEDELNPIFFYSPAAGWRLDEVRDANEHLWDRVRQVLVKARARRLLADTEGPLLTRAAVRETIIRCSDEVRIFQALRSAAPREAAGVVADFAVGLGHIADLEETAAQLWDRLTAIVELARSFQTTPVGFLLEVENAKDWVLKVTSSPDQYRRDRQENVNLRHPERVDRLYAQYEEGMARILKVRPAAVRAMRETILKGIPMGEDYWCYRAWVIQQMELDIQRIWPGQAVGGRMDTPEDLA